MENKNIATLETEIYKRDAIAINRLGMYRKLQELYGTDTAEEYLRQLEEHEIYRHDETGIILPKRLCPKTGAIIHRRLHGLPDHRQDLHPHA